MLHKQSLNTVFLFVFILKMQFAIQAQNKVFDSSRLHNLFAFGLSSTFGYANFKGATTAGPATYKQFALTLTPKAAFFITNNLSLGFKWEYGWYKSNFGRTEPNVSAKSLYAEYYFTKWRLYKWNTIKINSRRSFYIHPLINTGINLKNYYYGRDSSVKLITAIFNSRNNNISYKFLVGFNLNMQRRISIHFALGVDVASVPQKLLPATKLIRVYRQSDLGIAYFLKKKIKSS